MKRFVVFVALGAAVLLAGCLGSETAPGSMADGSSSECAGHVNLPIDAHAQRAAFWMQCAEGSRVFAGKEAYAMLARAELEMSR